MYRNLECLLVSAANGQECDQFFESVTGLYKDDFVICKPQKSVAELLSSEHEKQKAVNRAYHRKVLENLIFLSRQGLPLRGNWDLGASGAPVSIPAVADETGSGAEVQSNFHQLLLLRGKDDPNIIDIMQRKTRKYTDHHIQNELLQIMALSHLRKIAANSEASYFCLESDEVTDASNKEQVIVCLRWVDAQFEQP